MSASTQNQAPSALLFLYRHVLGVELPWFDGLVHVGGAIYGHLGKGVDFSAIEGRLSSFVAEGL